MGLDNKNKVNVNSDSYLLFLNRAYINVRKIVVFTFICHFLLKYNDGPDFDDFSLASLILMALLHGTIPFIIWILIKLRISNLTQNTQSQRATSNPYVHKPQIIKNKNSQVRSEARKRLREAKSDFEEGFLTHAEYQKILDENKPKIL